jgi:predicted alpha/beta-fold hydrolase
MGFVIWIILVLIIIFIVYRMTRRYQPTITFNQHGDCAQLLPRVRILKQAYAPTFWLFNRHLHSIWGLRFRPSSPLLRNVRREIFTFEDGGICALDWFEKPDTPPNVPIVHIIHTLTGSTRDPCVNNLAEAVVNHGWRAVVQNNRSCGGVDIKSERLYDAIRIDDQQAVIDRIFAQRKPAYLFMAGFSLGAYQAAQFCAKGLGVSGVALISHSYDGIGAALEMERPVQLRLYTPPITSKLVRMIQKSPFVNNAHAEKSKTMREFDDRFTSRALGLKDHTEYYPQCSIYDKIPLFKAPTLILGSEDDPFIRPSFLPIDQARKSDNAVLVTYPEGAHVGFCTGLLGRKSIADRIVIEWFSAIYSLKEDLE